MNESAKTSRRKDGLDEAADSTFQNSPGPNSSAISDNGVVDALRADQLVSDALTEDEFQQLRQEKIDSIRRAIAAGVYDSENLLEDAMLRMLQRLDLADALDHYEENI